MTATEQAPLRRDRDPRHRGRRESPKQSSRLIAILRAIATGLFTGLLIIFVLIGIAAIVVPAVTGSTALTVKTSSMEPSLPPGTMVVVRPTPIDDIKPGMVLTYQLHSGEPTLVTHRVTQRQALTDGTPVFITQGDANPQADPTPIAEVQIKGTVWYAIPYIGWVTALVTGPARAGLVSVVVAALLLYALWMVISALRDRRKRRNSSDTADSQDSTDSPSTGSASSDA